MGGITEKERAVLKGFLGEAYAIDKLDSERLATLLPQRITDVKMKPPTHNVCR
ncbi:MAG: hypothetical protein CM1200mP41_35480 [Gammaproteobacteria bacterium]|nr:MAG: hypothetical protein CM1200mP41_35480 [Gammaproteobacteria bacterium]